MAHKPTSRDLPGGPERDTNDHRRLRHGRDRRVGFAVGEYRQPAPMLFTRDGHNVFLGDTFRGRSAFLVCGGPSLNDHDLRALDERGFLTLAVNNAATVVRPRLWCSVDDPGNFCDVIWRDPGVWKFVPLDHMEKTFKVRDEVDALVDSDERVGDMPAVFGFRRNEAFQPDQWLTEDSFNWGNHSKRVDELGHKGSRSVMYVALRLLYFLGVRTVYLLGCDFRMREGAANYAFDQDRSRSSVRNNNSSYAILNARLERLRPHFEEDGFDVYNCTPDSGLTAFPYVPYEEAVESVRSAMPAKIVTAGMYDRAARERVASQAKPTTGDSAGRLPNTVIVPTPLEHRPALAGSIATWRRHRPDLAGSSTIVLTSADGDLPSLPSNFDVSFVRTRNGEAIGQRLRTVIGEQDAGRVFVVDPRAVADSSTPLPDSAFEAPLSGAKWGYAKPSDLISQLDEWAGHVPGLRDRPPLAFPFDATSDRIRVPALATWWWSVDVEWFRDLQGILASAPDTVELVTLLWYVARRREEAVARLGLKKMGWMHSYNWTARTTIRRAKRVLNDRGS